MPINLSKTNEHIEKLANFLTNDLFGTDSNYVSTKDLFVVFGGFLRAYGASMYGETDEDLDEMIEPAYDAIDANLVSAALVTYLIGTKLLNMGLVAQAKEEEDEDEELEGLTKELE